MLGFALAILLRSDVSIPVLWISVLVDLIAMAIALRLLFRGSYGTTGNIVYTFVAAIPTALALSALLSNWRVHF